MTHGVCRRGAISTFKVNNDMRLIVICKWKISGRAQEGSYLMNIYWSRLATVKYSYILILRRTSIKRIIFELKPPIVLNSCPMQIRETMHILNSPPVDPFFCAPATVRPGFVNITLCRASEGMHLQK